MNNNKQEKDTLDIIGKDEMNLAEYPITLMSKREIEGVDKIEISKSIIDKNGNLEKKEWIVTGSSTYGLPLAYDNDVIIGLLQIARENNFESPIIKFSRYRLCKILGWELSKVSYDRLKTSLKRIAGARIEAVNSFWDNKQRCNISLNFTLFNNLFVFEIHGSEDKNTKHEECFVELNNNFYRSIKNNYIKSLNTKLYFELKSAITKKLYRYLDKKRYGKNKFEIELTSLAFDHIGLLRKTYKFPSLIKVKLDAAHEELIEKGFLKTTEYIPLNNGSEKVLYIFSDSSVIKTDSDRTTDEKVNEKQDLLSQLLDLGVTEMIARNLVENYDKEKIREQIKVLPFRKANNPPAMLVNSIQENWAPTMEYKEKIESESRRKTNKAVKEKKEKEENEHKERVNNYLDSLSDIDRKSLEEEARERILQDGSNFMKESEILPHMISSYVYVLASERVGITE